MEDKTEVVNQVRAFNRFYTVLQGFLDRNYLDSGYSVTETRILFELRQSPPGSASRLVELLRLDKGYISRLIRGFEQKELVTRSVSAEDGRAYMIYLTPKGQQEADRLIDITNRKISRMIEPLSDEECDSLCGAMKIIVESLQGEEHHHGT